ncbi:MAG: tetratricopeptide repeat protein [Candidatus Eremiobacteraeota bacterium]|nr:tetratricopeptide repeat protein [Candidatus Eremiobacteraeota bacterium]MCW5866723.1 tetratricopeptide repeat protein [Candidatus Eremiobacteraeota bacterium]
MRRFLWLFLFLALVAASWNIYLVGEFNDDVAYISLARSLSQGHAYLSESSPGAPAHQRFPPGLPILLSPAQWLSPQNYTLCRLVVVACSALSMVLLASYTGGLAIPVLVGVHAYWLNNSSSVLSEQPFMVGLLLYLRAVEQPLTRRRSIFLGLGLGLVCLLRTVAIVLLPATLLFHWRQGRRHLSWFLLGVALSAGPLVARSLLTGYDGELDKNRDLIHNVLENLQILPARLGWMLLLSPDSVVGLPQWLGLLPLAVAALGLWKMRRESCAPAWVACCFAILLAWPYPFTRLLLPLVPFLLMGLQRQLGPVRWLWVLLVVLNLAQSAWEIRLHPARANDPGVIRTIKALPPGSAISSSEMIWWLETGVPCVSSEPAQALTMEWDWLDRLREGGVRLVVLYQKGRREEQRIVDSFQRRPHFYRLVYACPQAAVFAFQPPPGWLRSHTHQVVARQLLKQGRPELAVAVFQKALQAAPYDFSAASGLAYALVASGQIQAARPLLEQVRRRDPDCGEAELVLRFLAR